MIELHHIKIRSKNCLKTSKDLSLRFDFKPIAYRKSKDVFQIALSAGQTILIVSEILNQEMKKCSSESSSSALINNNNRSSLQRNCEKDSNFFADFYHEITSCSREQGSGLFETSDVKNNSFRVFDDVCIAVNGISCADETVYDVAFKVDNLQDCVELVELNNGAVVIPITKIPSQNGIIQYSLIKSCVGNVFHSLIDSSQYSGSFLPGYVSLRDDTSIFTELMEESRSESVHDLYTFTDHVTYALHRGTSVSILSWYENVFKMKRFLLNNNDFEDTGFVIQGKDVGLRLFAMKFWKCAEIGLKTDANFTIVLAESLEGQGPNQVDTFINEHEGPGVQHIGLSTSDIYTTLDKLKRNGVKFMIPPPTYYTKVGKADEMLSVGEDIHLLEKYGILLDSEAGSDEDNNLKFLMQVFTAPLFSRDTFFLEVIQRKGARGFGAGNITALWRSVDAYLQQKNS